MDCQKIIAVKKVNVIIDSYSIYNRIKSNSKLIKSLKYNNCNEIIDEIETLAIERAKKLMKEIEEIYSVAIRPEVHHRW